MNKEDIEKKMRADNFIENNGTVLRAINIGRTNFNRLKALRKVLEPDIDLEEFTDCVNYLSEAGYIMLRLCESRKPADIADDNIDEIEAKLSADGIRLLAGKIDDPCVRA